MRTRTTTWRTDEPCPTCGNDMTLIDDGGLILRAECRLCGHAEQWDTSDPTRELYW